MALLALTVAVVLAACGDGEDDRIIIELTSTPAATAELTSTPAATATPSADISSQFIDGVEVLPFTVGDEVELPDDVALIIETGCVNCHCPCIFGLVRAHRDASGEVRTENMFAGNILGNFALDDNASEIVVGVCSRGYCGPVEAISADAQTTLRRSVDGGATWEDVDVLEGAQAVIATTEEGILLNGRHGPGQEAQSGFWFFPSGDSIESSVEADVWRMISLPDGERAWLTTTGDLLRNDGSDFLAFDNVKQVLGIVLNYAGDGLVIEWSSSVESDRQHFLGTVGPDGYLLNALSSPAGGTRFGAWLTPTQAIGNAYVIPPGVEFDGTPGFWRFVIFDFESSTIHPIAMPSDLGGRGVLAVVQSPAD
ncbi:MAG: hypothetical protein IH865_08365 [Chloroflexi bacterium]|nr:hypothetical protein [Chloroflexota bacterium]